MNMTDTHTDDHARRYAEDVEKRRAEALHKADEQRKAGFEAEEKRRAEDFKANEERVARARKYMEARRKEDDRRAALSQSDRIAEDDRRAAMTPQVRAAEDESKGLTIPEQFDQINLLAGTPEYTVQVESMPHAAGFVLSEANGQLSRDNGNFVGPVTIAVGMPVAISAPAAGLVPPTYIPVATGNGATCAGLSLYGAVIATGTSQYLSILSRTAEVNSKLMSWGTLVAADQTAVIAALAAKGVIFR
jgi:hypothetical protein